MRLKEGVGGKGKGGKRRWGEGWGVVDVLEYMCGSMYIVSGYGHGGMGQRLVSMYTFCLIEVYRSNKPISRLRHNRLFSKKRSGGLLEVHADTGFLARCKPATATLVKDREAPLPESRFFITLYDNLQPLARHD
jgi:hypothetical protein